MSEAGEAARGAQILVLHPFADHTAASLSKMLGLISAIKQSDAPSEGSSTSMQIPWHISNRYYEANVCFQISSLNLMGSPSTNGPRRARRAVKMTAEQDTSAKVSEVIADEELRRKVKDVFQALEMPSSGSVRAGQSRSSDDRSEILQKEVEGVDAVMMIIDKTKSLRGHETLLSMLNVVKAEKAILSGFDLAISLVVAFPSPLEITSISAAPATSGEELSMLYAREGWEFIDLEGKDDVHDDDDDDDDEYSSVEGGDDREGTRGIDRIREALETHTWPGLIRKNERLATFVGQDENHSLDASPSSKNDDESALEDRIAAQALRSLRLDVASIDVANNAEPTQHDEELAQAFLKSILAVEAGHKPQESSESTAEVGSTLQRSLQSMQEELEVFLESQDSDWPGPSHHAQQERDIDEDAWKTDQEVRLDVDSEGAFEDDFTDFVAGPDGSETFQHQGFQPNSLLDDEVDPGLDDFALLKALEGDEHGQHFKEGGSTDPFIDFEATLSVVMAQAERVRSIKDHEKRRDEAARIALSLV
ncbi:hypothetical protein CBS101457_004484 [Exobasidium rhododendri]|nr:hypothetical protein CBS101457_004484 [Exobasidium rhododendri]